MSRPSYVEEKARIEVESELLNLASSYTGFGVNRRWVAKHILHKTDSEIEKMFEIDPTAPQQGGEGAMGGGMPMGGDLGSAMGGGGMEAPPEMPQQGQEMAPEVQGGQQGMEQVGGVPLLQNRRHLGDLLIETENIICEVKRYSRELLSLQESIRKEGLVGLTDSSRCTVSLTEKKIAKLTEPEEIFK
jgi:hypothetical protein